MDARMLFLRISKQVRGKWFNFVVLQVRGNYQQLLVNVLKSFYVLLNHEAFNI